MNKKNNERIRQLTIQDLKKMRERGEKFCVTTANDYNTAQMTDQAGIEVIGAGGALSTMVLRGDPTPFRATMEDVEFLLTRIAPAIKHAIVSTGLPYGSFQESNEQAIRNVVRLIKAGAHYVKIEGRSDLMLERMKAVIDIGIPVQGHVGLSPQLMREIGGFRVVGKSCEESLRVWDDMKRLEDIGVFMVEMECVPERIATELCQRTNMLVVGVGSGPNTHGQALMREDILGLQRTLTPKMAKKYVDLWPVCVNALKDWSTETKNQQFPAPENYFDVPEETFQQFMEELD
jgi:3-methyl-2-oxobutanoate hydroxymethyltransferase